MVLAAIAIWAAGCAATSTELAHEASIHQRRADRAAAMRDYRRAEAEQRRADKLLRESARRAQYERHPTFITPPPAAPPPGYYDPYRH